MNMQEAFDKLSPEEITLLNSDPQMLNDFKAKYGSKETPKPDPMLDTGLRAMTGSMNPNPPNIVPEAGRVPYTTGDQAGQMVADKMAEAGHPYAAGTFLNIPTAYNAALAASDAPAIASSLKGLGGLAKSGFTGLKDMAGEGVGKLRNMARIMMGPGEAAQNVAMQPVRNAATGFVSDAQSALQAAKQVPAELTQAKAELPQMQAKMAQLGGERQALVSKAGKNIQSLESGLGDLDSAKIQQIVSDPEIRTSTLKDLTKLAGKGPDAINAKMTARDIQQMRQFVQEVARNPDLTIEAPQAQQINTVLGQAMDKHIPGYKDALDLYKTAQEALEDAPNIKAQQLGQLRSRIKDMGDAFTNSKLDAADALKKAQVNAKQIIQKADMMVQQGKLSDVYRQRLYKGILATGILGGLGKGLSMLKGG